MCNEKSVALNILSLPREIQLHYLLYLKFNDIVNYALTCKSSYELLRDKYFWKIKTKADSHLPLYCFNDLFDKDGIIACNIYHSIVNKSGYTLSNNFPDEIIVYYNIDLAIINDHPRILDYFVKEFFDMIVDHKIAIIKDAMELSNVEIVKLMLERFNPDCYELEYILEDILYNIDTYRYHKRDMSDNPNNYQIIEYILSNFNVNYNIHRLILLIVLRFPFCKKNFEKLLVIGNYGVDYVISAVTENIFHLNDSDQIMFKRGCFYYVSISFIEWILTSYNINKMVMNGLCLSLFNNGENPDMIKRIALTGRLDISKLIELSIDYGVIDLSYWLQSDLLYHNKMGQS